jgi:Na+/proline symporter
MIPTPTQETAISTIIAVLSMLAISTIIGVLFYRKSKNFDEWLVGHRDLGPITTGLALTATWMSGWAIFGNAGLGYTYGWSGSWLIGITNLMGLSLCVVIGYRMRRYVSLGARTVPEVVKVRFDSKLLQVLTGITMILLLIVYSVGQYKAMASVWRLTTGSDWLLSLTFTAILCGIYLALGGYTGTQFSLALQGLIFMIIGWIFGMASIIWAGGPEKIAECLSSANYVAPGGGITSISLSGYTAAITPASAVYDWIGVTGALFMFLLMATGFPHNIARFLGMRKVTKREFTILMIIVILNCITPLMIGVMGFAARTVWGTELMKIAPVYGDAAATLVSMAIGGPLGGAVFSMAVFAAAISTLAGMVMIMATNITKDIINNIIPNIKPNILLIISRISIIPLMLIPLWWTYTSPPPLLSEFMAGSAVAQAGIFFFVVAVSMYWKRATKIGAICTIIYGIILTLLHPSVYGKYIPPFNHWGIWALTLMFGCGAMYFIISLLTKPLPKEKLDAIFSK